MLSVLYIDDDETNRDLVVRILARAPYDVQTREAANGKTGLEMALANPPDLILMDFHMPGISGPDAIRELRADPLTADIPVLALTADIYAREAFKDAGTEHFLTKPVRKRALLNAIDKIFPTLTVGTK